MHPIEFVTSMIAAGRAAEVAELVRRFHDKLLKSKTRDHAQAYNFASIFLISVASELGYLRPDQGLDDNKFLSVWSSLGFFGIDREEIDRYVKPTAPLAQQKSDSN